MLGFKLIHVNKRGHMPENLVKLGSEFGLIPVRYQAITQANIY